MSDPFCYERYSEFYHSRYGDFVRRHKVVGPYTLIEAQQEAGNLSGATTNEFLIVRTISRGVHTVDFGNGVKAEHWNPGDYAICPPSFSNIVISDAAHRLQIISIHCPEMLDIMGSSGVLFSGNFGKLHSRQRSDPVIKHSFNALFGKCESDDVLFVEGVVVDLILHLQRLSNDAKLIDVGGRDRLSKRSLRIALERLRTTDLPAPTLAELSTLTNLSPSHLLRAFKSETGMPPHRYHLVETMNRARTMIENGHRSLAEIATLLGFRDQSYFSRRFAMETGFSPSAWRERCRLSRLVDREDGASHQRDTGRSYSRR